MKKILLLALLLLPLGMMAGGTHEKVVLTDAGTLQERLVDSEYDTIDSLTVSGKFNSLDLKYIREVTGKLANLKYLNLTGIEFVDSDEEYYNWTEFGGAIGTYYPCHHYILSPIEYTESKYVGRTPNGQLHYYHHTPYFDCAFCSDSRMGDISGNSNATLKTICLPNAVSKIGEWAFNGCSVLEKVELAEGCHAVEHSAFTSSYLKTLVNSEKIDSIGDYAFSGTQVNAQFAPLRYVGTNALYGTAIESVSFADGIETIPQSAFYECVKLKEVLIPGTVEKIEKNAFSECIGITKVKIGEGTRVLGDYCFKGCISAEDFTLPSTITIVGQEALDGVPLNVDSDEGVQYIGTVAYKYDGSVADVVIREGTTCVASYFSFSYIDKMTSLSLPSTLKGIGEWAFGSYNQSCTIGQLNLPGGLEDIGKGAFEGWKQLSSVTIPASVKHLGSRAFMSCSALVRVNMNAEDCQINSKEYEFRIPFNGCTGIEVVTIGEGVKRIPTQCFDGLENLMKVTISSTVEEIGDASPSNDNWELNFYGGFSNCTKLKTVEFAENSKLKSIGKGAFQGCDALKEIIIPSSVEIIADYAFEGDYNEGSALEKVTFAEGSKLKEIGDCAFGYCTLLTSIELPEGLTTIGDNSFEDCKALSKIVIPSSVTSIGSDAFSVYEGVKRSVYITDLAAWCKIQFGSIKANPTNAWNSGNGGFTDPVDFYVNDEKITSLVIPEGVTSISKYAFCYNPAIISLTIPGSVTSIEEGAFVATDNIREVYTPSLTAWCKIKFGPNRANPLTLSTNRYSDSPSSPALVIGGVEEIADDIVLPSDVTAIPDYAFAGFDRITSITIPEGVTSIGEGAFYECPKLNSVTIPNSMTAIDNLAFNKCKNLESVYSYIMEPFAVGDDVFSLVTYYRGDSYPEANNATLYIPQGTLAKYEALTGWCDYFIDIVEMEATENETAPIEISPAKQVPYCSDKNLDFTDKPELKAYVATGYDKATGTIWLTRVKQVPAKTGFLLLGDPGDYDIPVVASVSDVYYKNMFKGTLEGTTLYTTDGDYTNYYLSKGDAGVGFYKVTKEEGVKVGANRCYLPILTEIPAKGSEGDVEMIKVTAAKQVPYYTSKNLDFTTMDAQGVKAYTATGYNYSTGVIWLTRVKKVPAQTGILVMADGEGEYNVPTASVQSVYENMFVGSETAQTIYTNEEIDGVDYINYYLSKGDAGVGFYKVTNEDGVKMGANRCYLPIPKRDAASGARGKSSENAFCQMILSDEANDDVIAIPLFADDATGINVQSSMFNLQSNEVYYNLQGQRVDNPGKGLYIKNGKKVILR